MAVAHIPLSEALNRTILDPIPGSRTVSPATLRAPAGLSSPFRPLSPVSRCSSASPSPSTSVSYYSAQSDLNSIPRRRPAPISIPTGTADDPLFSAYPINSQQATKTPDVPPTLHSGTALPRKAMDEERPWQHHDNSTASSSTRKGHGRTESTISLSRHRSTSAIGLVKKAQDRFAQFGTPKPAAQFDNRRRASFDTGENEIERWREMGEAAQLENSVPYGYSNHDGYTLQSVKMVSGVRPLSPALVPPRKSSLASAEESIVSFSTLTISNKDELSFDKQLDGSSVADRASLVSDTLSSSPSAMTKSLPSTKTSLSRSARSGQEGDVDAKKIQLQQVSAKLSAETTKVLLDKRRMILLEIVETEVTYVHDLRSLVHIYLPQLAVLPHVSERIHSLVVRNTTDLLEFHVQFAAHMVDILRYCGIGYETTDAETVDKATIRFAELFVREVRNINTDQIVPGLFTC